MAEQKMAIEESCASDVYNEHLCFLNCSSHIPRLISLCALATLTIDNPGRDPGGGPG